MRLILVASLFVLAACSSTTTDSGTSGGQGSSSGGTTSSSGGSSGSSTATVNGVPADEFYAQFQLETIKTSMDGAAAIPAQSNGNNAFLTSLFLQKDGSFTLFYVEGKGEVTSSGHSLNYDSKQGRKVTGSWSVQGTSLVAGPFKCSGLSFNGENQLRCELKSAVVSAGAVGKSASLTKGISQSSPSDSRFADYR
jgi:hypothetical protein